MQIILLAGYAGSGKDTVGALFVKRGFIQFAFGHEVKVHSSQLHGFPFELTQTQEGKEFLVKSQHNHQIASVRTFLIEDSAYMKKLKHNPAYWATKVADAILKVKCENVVITDWRFKAEYENLKQTFPDANIMRIRVYRPSVTPLESFSEHELDEEPMTFTIHNTGTIEELDGQVEEILQSNQG
jgi:hypothetical protein